MDERAIGEQAAAFDPDGIKGGNALGMALRLEGRLEDAAEVFQWILKNHPQSPSARNNLAGVRIEQGLVDEGLGLYREVLDIDPDNYPARANLAFCSCYSPDLTGDEVYALHRAWNDRYAAPLKQFWQPFRGEKNPPRLKIGYASSDLCAHPVGAYLEPVLAAHDRQAFEIHVLSTGGPEDPARARLRGLTEHWHDLAGLPPEDLARTVTDLGLHLLVDLGGMTAPANLLAFALHPAPVQIAWCGYPFSTGLDAMDYLLIDRGQVPPEAERWCAEAVVELTGDNLCWTPPAAAPDPGALPFEANGSVTFGVFNNLSKLNAPLFRLWARVLDAVPDSRLVIKASGLNDAPTRAWVSAELAAAGIGPERCTLMGQSDQATHLAAMNGCDIALDSHPYSGGVTTLEALWQGLPVLTLAGETYFSRHALTHLTALGLDDLVAFDADGFVAAAQRLAGDRARLAGLRADLRSRLAQSVICDGPGFTAQLERVYQSLWTRYLSM